LSIFEYIFLAKTKSIIQCRNFGIIQSTFYSDIELDLFSWDRVKFLKKEVFVPRVCSGTGENRDGIFLPSRILLMLAFDGIH